MIKMKIETLEDFFKEHQYTLLVLSIFLLVTISLAESELYLSGMLSLLSALLTYSLLLGIKVKSKNSSVAFSLRCFKIVWPVFVVSFCCWTILNIVGKIGSPLEIFIWVIIWLLLICIYSIKVFLEEK